MSSITRVSIFTALMTLSVSVKAATIASDNFDAPLNLNSFTVNPDLSANQGFFPTDNRFDIFGVTNRAAAESRNSFDLLDDTAGSFAGDTFGILGATKADNVFAIEDMANGDFSGTGTAVWVFDISGAQSVDSISIDFAAMGDFETSNDSLLFTVQIDAGPLATVFTLTPDEDASLQYILESGSNGQLLNDPMQVNGTIIDNHLTTFSANLGGVTGSTLTLSLAATSDGGSEVVVFDNILIQGTVVPEANTMILTGMAATVAAFMARRRQS